MDMTQAQQKTEQTKREALIAFLDCGLDDIEEGHDADTFEMGRQEYLVLTDEEADAKAQEAIEQSVWAFNASFICSFCDLPSEMEEAIQAMQEKRCEGANDAILALIEKSGGIEDFAAIAISADGRGPFLSGYDGNENEEGNYFIYRTN